MTAKEYILDNLHLLTGTFQHIRVRYEYDRIAEVHVIEIVPNETYRLDDEYIKWEEEMTDRFIDLFPTQNICFVSDDALVGIRNAEYILEGLAYAPISVDPTLITPMMPITITAINATYESSLIEIIQAQQDNKVFFGDYIAPALSYQLAA